MLLRVEAWHDERCFARTEVTRIAYGAGAPRRRRGRRVLRLVDPPAGPLARLASAGRWPSARAPPGRPRPRRHDLSGLPGRFARALAAPITSRIPRADLDERDPDYIRETLPRLWLLTSLWFRGEIRGMGNVPEEGPVLLVGNHSGGNLTPDTALLTLAFSAFFGVERPFYQLAHNLVLSMPGLGFLRRFGTVAASPENAEQALRSGARRARLPRRGLGGPPPELAERAGRLRGRKGFIRLALAHDVPIVPVVSIGGQETALFLSRGERLARALMLDRLFRLKVLPISIAAPWGLNVGDFLGHIPLPGEDHDRGAARHRPARASSGDDPDVGEVYDHVIAPDAGHPRRAGRRAPAAHHRLMRVAAQIEVSAPPELIWDVDHRPVADAATSCRASPAGRSPATRTAGLGARYRMLMRVGSAEIGSLVEVVECDERRDLAWTSITGIDQRGRWRLRPCAAAAAARRTRVEFRLAYGVAGAGFFGWVSERIAAPTVQRPPAPLAAAAQARGRARAAARGRGRAAGSAQRARGRAAAPGAARAALRLLDRMAASALDILIVDDDAAAARHAHALVRRARAIGSPRWPTATTR